MKFGTYDEFDPKCVSNLKRIIKHTGAEIVISSTWRLGKIKVLLQEQFGKHTLPQWIGVTPCFNYDKTRREEIQAYLDTRDDVESYVFLDDEYIHTMKEGKAIKEPDPFWVKTNIAMGGLLDEHYVKAIEILNGS